MAPSLSRNVVAPRMERYDEASLKWNHSPMVHQTEEIASKQPYECGVEANEQETNAAVSCNSIVNGKNRPASEHEEDEEDDDEEEEHKNGNDDGSDPPTGSGAGTLPKCRRGPRIVTTCKDVTIFPRRKAGQDKLGSSRPPIVITREILEGYFTLPQHVVCKKLGICATVVKKVCRSLGIKKWPFKSSKSTIRKMAQQQQLLWQHQQQQQQQKQQQQQQFHGAQKSAFFSTSPHSVGSDETSWVEMPSSMINTPPPHGFYMPTAQNDACRQRMLSVEDGAPQLSGLAHRAAFMQQGRSERSFQAPSNLKQPSFPLSAMHHPNASMARMNVANPSQWAHFNCYPSSVHQAATYAEDGRPVWSSAHAHQRLQSEVPLTGEAMSGDDVTAQRRPLLSHPVAMHPAVSHPVAVHPGLQQGFRSQVSGAPYRAFGIAGPQSVREDEMMMSEFGWMESEPRWATPPAKQTSAQQTSRNINMAIATPQMEDGDRSFPFFMP